MTLSPFVLGQRPLCLFVLCQREGGREALNYNTYATGTRT
jgi:hypothetical protein